MTLEGWLTMLISIGGVLILAVWCFVKVFRTPDDQGESAIHLITPDMEEYEEDDDQSS